MGGVVTWRVLDQAAHSTTIPASFDGQWKGTDSVGAGFTATLRKDLQLGQLNSANSMCYVGSLSVSDATDSQLTTRLAPEGPGCSQWTVVFTHLSGGELRMAVDPDGSAASQPPFEVRMTKQG